MHPIDMVRLVPLMARSRGRPEVAIGLIDGPVETRHPDLAHLRAGLLPAAGGAACRSPASGACRHGTFVAGILAGRRGSPAPSIAPGCTLLIHPVFAEAGPAGDTPRAPPGALAEALGACVAAGARVINVSAALVSVSGSGARDLIAALDAAARRGVIVVAAAGNGAGIGSSALSAHPGVIAVIGCGSDGRPLPDATLSASAGCRGLAAPGDAITSLDPRGGVATMAGSSAAAPFVTGTLALLWSVFPRAPARLVRAAVTRLGERARRSIVPPLLDAEAGFLALKG